jgi:hypothetical protein
MNNTPDAYWQSLGLAAPARRALISAGIMTIHNATDWRAVDLAQLHGIGNHAMTRLRQALANAQLSFADEPVASD